MEKNDCMVEIDSYDHRFIVSNGYFVCKKCGFCDESRRVYRLNDYTEYDFQYRKMNKYEYKSWKYTAKGLNYRIRKAFGYYRSVLLGLGISVETIDYVFNRYSKLKKKNCYIHPQAILIIAYLNVYNKRDKASIKQFFNDTTECPNKGNYFHVYKAILKQKAKKVGVEL